jgi:hypothetical protein
MDAADGLAVTEIATTGDRRAFQENRHGNP